MNKIAFFGTSDFSVKCLETMATLGTIPSLIICGEDKPQGRNLVVTPPPAKVWAQAHNIKTLQPKSLKTDEFVAELSKEKWDVFVVASYGKLIPKNILEMPKGKTINIHPSLLPKLRGASPLPSAILTEDKTGVTIMLLDEEMDHGPIIAQKEVSFENWPPRIETLKNTLAEEGANLLISILPKWLSGEIKATEQEHTKATYTKKIQKSDGRIDLSDNHLENWKKIQAYTPWPSAYFFVTHKDKEIRVIIKDATFSNNELKISRVLPEGRREMSWQEFESGFIKNI